MEPQYRRVPRAADRTEESVCIGLCAWLDLLRIFSFTAFLWRAALCKPFDVNVTANGQSKPARRTVPRTGLLSGSVPNREGSVRRPATEATAIATGNGAQNRRRSFRQRAPTQGGREASATRVHHRSGGGERPAEAAETVWLRAAGVEGPVEELREGARVVPPDRVAPRTFVRAHRASHPHRPRAGTRIPREARIRRCAGPRPARGSAEALADGRAPPEAPRDEQDHDGEVDPADRGGAGLEAPPEHGGPELVLGRRGWRAQVLRGDPRGPAAPLDPERPEDQLDYRAAAPRARVPRAHERGPEGPRLDVQGQGRREGAAEHRGARPEGQVATTCLELGLAAAE